MCNDTPQFSIMRESMCSSTTLMIDSTKSRALCNKCSHFRRLSKPTRAFNKKWYDRQWWEMVLIKGQELGWLPRDWKMGPSQSGKWGVLVLNKSNPTSPNSKQRTEGLMCSHYGNSKHTQDTCFKLHGYPDWGHELQAKKKRNGTNIEPSTDKMVVAATNPICL